MSQFSFREDPRTGAIYVEFLGSDIPFAFSEPENDAQWYRPGEVVTIRNFTLTGGFFYVGTSLLSFDSYRNEPSLIDPHLKIAKRGTTKPLHYPRPYDDLSPSERTTYLTWLSTGRQDPSIDIQYVLLFFFGLERRVLDDPDENADIDAELPEIHAEVSRLLNLYGPENDYFNTHAASLLSILDNILPPPDVFTPAPPPSLLAETWKIPLSIPMTIGQFAANKMPVPPDWALAWIWYHSETRLRTPAIRCKNEFARLFALRYSSLHGEGLVIRQGQTRMHIVYEPANFSMMHVPIRFDTIPDVFEKQGPIRKLRAIFNQVTDELDAYSRWIGRNPGRSESLAAFAQLPPDLASSDHSASKAFSKWANMHLATADPVPVPGEEIVELWLGSGADRMTKAQSTAFLDLSQRLGFGFEPDVRFGGPSINSTPTVLFPIPPDAPQSADPAYAMATTIVHLAAAVAAADGGISRQEATYLETKLASHLDLPAAVRTRLFAHLLWLSTTNITLAGLKKRLEPFSDTRRGSIGDILIALAASDGTVSPAEMSMLIRIFRLLHLDPNTVTHRIHASLASGGSASPRTSAPSTPGSTSSKGLHLDPAVVARIQSETSSVSSLLSDIFMDDDTTQPTPEEPEDNDIAFQGLDLPHARLLTALGARDHWTREEFEHLASSLQLMPGGAIDVINDAAFDIIGDPIIEGEDDLTINTDLIEELKT